MMTYQDSLRVEAFSHALGEAVIKEAISRGWIWGLSNENERIAKNYLFFETCHHDIPYKILVNSAAFEFQSHIKLSAAKDWAEIMSWLDRAKVSPAKVESTLAAAIAKFGCQSGNVTELIAVLDKRYKLN